MNDIKEITQEELTEIIETYEPRGLFYMPDVIENRKVFLGIDNSTGEAWTEIFDTLEHCKNWLLRG